jgi:hypothetical protein
MESIFFESYRYGILLQLVAIVHFIRRRPDNFWIWIILIGGGLGALVYIAMEVVPDVVTWRGTSNRLFQSRRRASELEAQILDNPSPGNLEELADIYLEQKQYVRARELYNRVIRARPDLIDPHYRRALTAIALEDYAAAIPDLERVVAADPKYDFHRARSLLATAYGQTGQVTKANALFMEVTRLSTSSETQYNYASFLASQHRNAEARDWAQQILAKKPAMPRYQRRMERPWFRKASALLKRLPVEQARSESAR